MMRENTSFFKNLFYANYDYVCRNSKGMHRNPQQGKGPAMHGHE